MKYIDEFRNKDYVRSLIDLLNQYKGRHIKIMEICGGQTHTIMKYDLESALSPNISFLHGPGCPVCVTPAEYIDIAVSLALQKNNIVVTYGDMLRVPGSGQNLLQAKSEGADVRIVYSPLDAVRIAKANESKNIIFFAVGFETTAPANARAIIEAHNQKLNNFFVLCSQMLVPSAVELILNDRSIAIDGLIAAGHVCTVMGFEEYTALAAEYNIPIVITGFEPADILFASKLILNQIEKNSAYLDNQYSRVVKPEGNLKAKELINEVFEPEDREWRGIGIIKNSGLKLNNKYSAYDALNRFDINNKIVPNERLCIAGDILKGLKTPFDCPSFGSGCNPERPLGAPMVSSEGACAAYFMYNRHKSGV